MNNVDMFQENMFSVPQVNCAKTYIFIKNTFVINRMIYGYCGICSWELTTQHDIFLAIRAFRFVLAGRNISYTPILRELID